MLQSSVIYHIIYDTCIYIYENNINNSDKIDGNINLDGVINNSSNNGNAGISINNNIKNGNENDSDNDSENDTQGPTG